MTVERLGFEKTSLDLIQRGASLARQTRVNVAVDELAESIRIQGLMEPIHLVEIKENKMYELIDGQRRYLAYLKLGKDDPEKFSKIPSFVYKNTMTSWEKKTMSIQANISQEPMDRLDAINAVTVVYEHFGNIKDTVQATGLSDGIVRKYVKLARLPEKLQSAINGGISIGIALEAADLYNYDSNMPDVDIEEIIETAKQMQKLAGKQRRYVREYAKNHPERQIPEIIKTVKSKKYATRKIPVRVESDTYERMDAFRSSEKTDTIPLAAVDLIHDGLEAHQA